MIDLNNKDVQYSSNPDWQTNMENWIKGLLKSLGHPQGTFVYRRVSDTLHVDLYTVTGQQLSRYDCRPLPLDITFLANHKWVASDPRHHISELIRLGPNFMSRLDEEVELAPIDQNEQYLELSKDRPIRLDKYLTLFELMDFQANSDGTFWFWQYQPQVDLMENYERLGNGQLLQWSLSDWLANWVNDTNEEIKMKYAFQRAGILSEQDLQPGLELSAAGHLIIRAIDHEQAKQFLQAAYRTLYMSRW